MPKQEPAASKRGTYYTLAVAVAVAGATGWFANDMIGDVRVPGLLAVTECASAYASTQDPDNPNDYFELLDKNGDPIPDTFVVEYTGTDGKARAHVAFFPGQHTLYHTPTHARHEWGNVNQQWDTWFTVDPVNSYAEDDSMWWYMDNADGDTLLVVNSVRDGLNLFQCYTEPSLPTPPDSTTIPPIDPPASGCDATGWQTPGLAYGGGTPDLMDAGNWILVNGFFGSSGTGYAADADCLDDATDVRELSQMKWLEDEVIVFRDAVGMAEVWIFLKDPAGEIIARRQVP